MKSKLDKLRELAGDNVSNWEQKAAERKNKRNQLKDSTLSALEARGVKFALIVTNETQYWRDDIQKKAGHIYGYALVNLTEPTNLCSPQVNFPFEMMYYRMKNYKNFTEDELIELERVTEDNGYYLETENVSVIKTWSDTDKTFEDIVEYLSGNPISLL